MTHLLHASLIHAGPAVSGLVPQAPQATTRKRISFGTPSTASCTVDASVFREAAAMGMTFVGCKGSTASSQLAAQATAANQAKVADLVTSDTQQFVLTTHAVDSKGRLFVKSVRKTIASMRSGMKVGAGTSAKHGNSSFPGNVTSPPSMQRGRKLLQDNRFRISSTTSWPWRALGYLSYKKGGSNWRCSGTLVSPDDVLTAAHCLVDSVTGEQYTDIEFIPGKSGSYEPYGR